jgi:hypothetical protein
MSYIGTLIKHCDHIKPIDQEKQEEFTLQSATMKNSNATLHSPSGMWIPIYNYLYQKFI